MSKEALKHYRRFIKACKCLFRNDKVALDAAKVRVRAEFRKNKDVTDTEQLKNLFIYSEQTERYLRQNVVQATLVGENTYRVRLTSDTVLEKNAPLPGDRHPSSSGCG
eukprot:Em0001g1947a